MIWFHLIFVGFFWGMYFWAGMVNLWNLALKNVCFKLGKGIINQRHPLWITWWTLEVYSFNEKRFSWNPAYFGVNLSRTTKVKVSSPNSNMVSQCDIWLHKCKRCWGVYRRHHGCFWIYQSAGGKDDSQSLEAWQNINIPVPYRSKADSQKLL